MNTLDMLLASQLGPGMVAPHPILSELIRAHHAVEQVADRGFVEIPCTSVQRLFDQARTGFTRLLLEGTKEHRTAFRVPVRDWERDEISEPIEYGLLPERRGKAKKTLTRLERAENRRRADPNKKLLHYHPRLLMRLFEQDPSLISLYADLLGSCGIFNSAAHNIALALSYEFDAKNEKRPAKKQYPGSLFMQTHMGETVTRLLRYAVVQKSKFDAGVHRDRGCWTVHAHSSHPGLGVFDRKGQLVSVNENDPKHILLFPGVKWSIVTRYFYGLGLFHGAKDTRRQTAESLVGAIRDVTVSFAHCRLSDGDLKWFYAQPNDSRLDTKQYQL